MSKQGKELEKQYKLLVEDIFDHFDEYTDGEKQQIRNELHYLNRLNNILEKYDKKQKAKTIFDLISQWWNNATGK